MHAYLVKVVWDLFEVDRLQELERLVHHSQLGVDAFQERCQRDQRVLSPPFYRAVVLEGERQNLKWSPRFDNWCRYVHLILI